MVKKILYGRKFLKNYQKRIALNHKLKNQFSNRVKQFVKNSSDSVLRDHKLGGQLKFFRSFSITGDTRVIYQELSGNRVLFYDVGSHNQVY